MAFCQAPRDYLKVCSHALFHHFYLINRPQGLDLSSQGDGCSPNEFVLGVKIGRKDEFRFLLQGAGVILSSSLSCQAKSDYKAEHDQNA